ncbi:MAG: ATP-grasp fold amidoligase family protein, partial [Candidatus Dormiibacterota bacterium]
MAHQEPMGPIKRVLDRWLRAVTEHLPEPLGRRIIFLLIQHQIPHFTHPVSFSEKINWRLLNDRREVIRTSCDKLVTKDKAKALGYAVPDTVWVGTDVRELGSLRLPTHWVLKPNHGSGLTYFGAGQVIDMAQLEADTAGWIEQARHAQRGEWAYSHAKQVLLVEEMLEDGGGPPPDYKFFVFDGKPVVACKDESRFSRHTRRVNYLYLVPLDVQYVGGW